MFSMLPAIAVKENATGVAFSLIQRGYTQSLKSLQCPLCGQKYLLLLDDRACPRTFGIDKDDQCKAIHHLLTRICETHSSGHRDHKLVMFECSQAFHARRGACHRRNQAHTSWCFGYRDNRAGTSRGRAAALTGAPVRNHLNSELTRFRMYLGQIRKKHSCLIYGRLLFPR